MRKKKSTEVVAVEEKDAPAESKSVELMRDITSIPVFYANQAMIQTSQMDVRIIFCQIQGAKEGGGVLTNPQTIVYMPIDHARRVAKILNDQLQKYESEFPKASVN